MKSNLDLIADKARQNVNMKFTSLIHHINEENLLQCYSELKRNKACGIDGVTLEGYGNKLNENIKLLVQKLKTKEYRHKPVKRVYIPKPCKSEKRGLGIPALEDKLEGWPSLFNFWTFCYTTNTLYSKNPDFLVYFNVRIDRT